jgi:hypothetical protein
MARLWTLSESWLGSEVPHPEFLTQVRFQGTAAPQMSGLSPDMR